MESWSSPRGEPVFRHCVMMKFADEATAEQRQAMRDTVASLPSHIPEILNYSVGFDAGLRDDNYHLVVVGDFADKDAYEVYATHPEHVRVVKEVIGPIAVARAAVQYEV